MPALYDLSSTTSPFPYKLEDADIVIASRLAFSVRKPRWAQEQEILRLNDGLVALAADKSEETVRASRHYFAAIASRVFLLPDREKGPGSYRYATMQEIETEFDDPDTLASLLVSTGIVSLAGTRARRMEIIQAHVTLCARLSQAALRREGIFSHLGGGGFGLPSRPQ